MPKRPKLVAPSILAADRAALKAAQDLSDYLPTNPLYSIENLLLMEQTLTQAERSDDLAEDARLQSHRVRAETSTSFHSAVRGLKAQVLAQYGDDSYAIKAIGLTRRSEYKQPTRQKKSG